MEVVTKILVFVFIFACLYVVKTGVKFFTGLFTKNNELPVFERKELLFTGLSLSYILTLIITGFGF